MKCERCGSDYAESYYKDKYSDKIICDECLLELDCISYSTVTYYYLEGEYMGDTCDYNNLLDNVAYALDYEEVKE